MSEVKGPGCVTFRCCKNPPFSPVCVLDALHGATEFLRLA
jgi:hypothetical protein